MKKLTDKVALVTGCAFPSAAESRSDAGPELSLLGLQPFFNLVKERLKGTCGGILPAVEGRLQHC